MMTGKEFRAARKALGMKGTDMAKAMCVSYRTLQGWELGERGISPWAVRLLSFIQTVPREQWPPLSISEIQD